ncbi:PREDICTED: BPTI/Kunitz domain-containing protein-like [Papilio xuthus]|uniref:BPTI/Kunitz domain-containing protein-like n=1 Tax=Papilio xuthus TaxID=66420 RepID=A0AAJ6ZJH0_PAPXU|nr:PREDICTED: BPTI/Kunitz domain-containing protein-like [Papilio xuthus]
MSDSPSRGPLSGALETSHSMERPPKRSKSSVTSQPVIAKICYLKPDSGPCRADIAMYYFSPETNDCPRFSWGGCQGNGNRFDTKQDCLSTCLSQPDRQNIRPPYCSLTFDYGYCFGAVPRWYFDPRWKVCKKTIYSGCGGNKNNFYSMPQCDSICRFGTGRIKEKKDMVGDPKKVLIINPTGATRARVDKN